MKKNLILTLLLCLYHPHAWSYPSDLLVSVGNLCEFIGVYQTNESGDKNTCSFLPYFSSSLDIVLDKDWAVSPELSFTLPHSGRDKNVSILNIATLINAKYKTQYLNLIFGTGFYFTRISGPGGEETLNNGNSTDSFPLPQSAVYSRNFILHLSLGHDFNTEWSTELYSYVFNSFTTMDRSLSAGAKVTYHFGDLL